MKLWRSFRYYFYSIVAVLFVIGCASTGSPSGGPRDTQAPSVVEEKSSTNFSTNFTPEKVEIVFDEWIELKNPQKEILISPPFFKKPKISYRGKKVTVEFPEEEPLRPDATYTLNFGNSIVDFTEGNPVEGYRFLFSTGDKIDSLTFEGSIVDAFGGEPVKEILVMLYDVLADSAVVSEKPFYFAKSKADGTFKFENLKNDSFKLLVLDDINLNYLLDPELERLAFTDSIFILNDSSEFNPVLRVFQPEQSTRIVNSNSKTPGVITTVFNKAAKDIDYKYLYPSDFDPIVETREDTMRFWFSEAIDSAGLIFELDTLDFNIKPFDTTFNKANVRLSGLQKALVAPFDSLKLLFSSPLLSVDTSLIKLTNKPKPIIEERESIADKLGSGLDSLSIDSTTVGNDSLRISTQDSLTINSADRIFIDSIVPDSIAIDSLGLGIDSLQVASEAIDTIFDFDFNSTFTKRNLYINSNWKESYGYQLVLLPGAITDIYDRTNDTIRFDFKTLSADQFGNINLTVTDMDSTEQFIVVLMKGKKEIGRELIMRKSFETVKFNRLAVGDYLIRLIKDENDDGKWTTGDYWEKRQPELLKEFKLEALRENWDLEASISWEVQDTTSSKPGIEELNVAPGDSIKVGQIKSSIPNKSKNKSKSGSKASGRGRN